MVLVIPMQSEGVGLLVVPAIISVVGVLIVGALTALLNRRIHLERLQREEVIVRRDAFTKHLATAQERDSINLTYQEAYDTFQRVNEQADSQQWNDMAQLAEVGRLRKQVDDRLRAAVHARDEWSNRAIADQMAALVSITNIKSPLVLTVKLPVVFHSGDPGYSAAMEVFIESLRVDAVLSHRRRTTAEKELMSRIVASYPQNVLFPASEPDSSLSPSPAGHHGTHRSDS